MENSMQNLKINSEDNYSNVLFVSDLPNETTYEDLQKIFQDYHFLYASLNNFKNNISWAQVHLENKEFADKARHELNGYILKPINCVDSSKIKPIRICKYEGKSSNKQTNIKQSLLVKNIDINMTQKEFYNIFLEYGDIDSGKIEYDENGISKGFGYIYYFTEEAAEEAKKNLNGKSFYGKNMEIVNLIPTKKNRNNIITLFVLNIPKDATEEKLTSIFEKFGPVSNISINPNGYAYVSYDNFNNASKCLNEMKTNPISFPDLPNIVVKYARPKEERETKKIYNAGNNFEGKNNIVEQNLNIQFNCLYYNPEIKTDLELDKEIRLFIKVVTLMDFNPKEVLVDLESMSGLVTFDNYKDYNLFFKKYREFCTKRPPLFECIPYEIIPTNDEPKNNNNFEQQQNYNSQEAIPANNQIPFNRMPNNPISRSNNLSKRNNVYPNMNMGIPMPNMMMNPSIYNNMNKNPMSYGINYMNNMNNINNRFIANNKYFKNNKDNNNNNNNPKYNNNEQSNEKNNIGNNQKAINQRQTIPNNNQKYIFRQNYGNSYNININMHPGITPINPILQQQMLFLASQKNQMINNYLLNNISKPINSQNANYNNFIQRNNFINNKNTNPYTNNFRNDLNEQKKNDVELIDQRNLQNLNPSQLQSQFNKPPINVYGPNMLNNEEQEDLVNEIADSIYEIVYAKYPKEASKITGMIKEKGYEKMNMLLSKKEDLNEIIDKAYEMIKNSRNNKSENSNE